jgi:hypothetical protein
MIEREAIELNRCGPALAITWDNGELALSNRASGIWVKVKISADDRQKSLDELSRDVIAPAVDYFQRRCKKFSASAAG